MKEPWRGYIRRRRGLLNSARVVALGLIGVVLMFMVGAHT